LRIYTKMTKNSMFKKLIFKNSMYILKNVKNINSNIDIINFCIIMSLTGSNNNALYPQRR